jgi:hypothetical protein
MLAPVRNRAQFLTANRNTLIRGRTRSYDLRLRRATADSSCVVYVQMIEQSVLAAVNSRTLYWASRENQKDEMKFGEVDW